MRLDLANARGANVINGSSSIMLHRSELIPAFHRSDNFHHSRSTPTVQKIHRASDRFLTEEILAVSA